MINYILLQTNSSYCPKCNKPLQLLHDSNDLTSPQFYICFEDKFISQIGKDEILLTIDSEI